MREMTGLEKVAFDKMCDAVSIVLANKRTRERLIVPAIELFFDNCLTAEDIKNIANYKVPRTRIGKRKMVDRELNDDMIQDILEVFNSMFVEDVE